MSSTHADRRHQRPWSVHLDQQATSFIGAIGTREKQLYVFTLGRDGSSDHCRPDNVSLGQEVKFDWLDRTFDHSATEWSDRDR